MKISKGDSGADRELYALPKSWREDRELKYDKAVQTLTPIVGNLVSVFEDWFYPNFEHDLFKTIRLTTESSISQFKGFMRDIYKKSKPVCIISPSIEVKEDNLYNQISGHMYNQLVSNPDIGHSLLYATTVIQSDGFELHHRSNRFIVKFDIMIVEKSLSRQLELYSYILNKFRFNSMFNLTRNILSQLPTYMMMNMANVYGMDYKSDKFLDFINTVSLYPITRRIHPGGFYKFYMGHEVNINVTIPNIPAKDGVENIGAIEKGARITFGVEMDATLPSEFIITIPGELMVPKFEKFKEEDHIYYVPELKVHPDYESLDGLFTLTNILDVSILNDEENEVDVVSIVSETLMDDIDLIKQYTTDTNPIHNFIKTKVYINGTFDEVPCILSDTGVVSIPEPDFRKIYSICVYLNYHAINTIRSTKYIKKIGTVVE